MFGPLRHSSDLLQLIFVRCRTTYMNVDPISHFNSITFFLKTITPSVNIFIYEAPLGFRGISIVHFFIPHHPRGLLARPKMQPKTANIFLSKILLLFSHMWKKLNAWL